MFGKKHSAFIATAIVALLTFASAAYAVYIAINKTMGRGWSSTMRSTHSCPVARR